MKHQPVLVDEKAGQITCRCGVKTSRHKRLDDAWDEYDDHTME